MRATAEKDDLLRLYQEIWRLMINLRPLVEREQWQALADELSRREQLMAKVKEITGEEAPFLTPDEREQIIAWLREAQEAEREVIALLRQKRDEAQAKLAELERSRVGRRYYLTGVTGDMSRWLDCEG